MSQVTEVSSQSWFSRILGSLKGIFFGIILAIVAVVLLFWNEGRSVATYQSLKEGSKSVVSISADAVDKANDGKLVHVTGNIETSGTLEDSAFGVTSDGIRLIRNVEMFQWDEESKSETKKKLGGGTETVTTYTPTKKWSSSLIDSDSFHGENKQKRNPGSMLYSSKTLSVSEAKLGAFDLPKSLLDQVDQKKSLSIPDDAELPEDLQGKAKREGGGYYIGENPSSPQIGDLKIEFKEVPDTLVSIVAQQSGSTFKAYPTKAGKPIEMLEVGSKDAATMFADAQSANKMMTWMLRLGGWILMAFGFGLVLKPLSVVADVVPFIGSIVGAGTGLIGFLLSTVVSLIVISIAWLFYRPLLGVTLILIAVGVAVFIGLMIGKARKRRMMA